MKKQQERDYIKGLFGGHIEFVEKVEQHKEAKIEMEDKVNSMLELLKYDGLEEKETTAKLIPDLQKQYQILYADYDRLIGVLNDEVSGYEGNHYRHSAMKKQQIRDYIKGLFGGHIEFMEKVEQHKEAKIEMQDKVDRMFWLLKYDGLEEKGALAKLILDLQKQYQILYADYDRLTGALKEVDSEYYTVLEQYKQHRDETLAETKELADKVTELESALKHSEDMESNRKSNLHKLNWAIFGERCHDPVEDQIVTLLKTLQKYTVDDMKNLCMLVSIPYEEEASKQALEEAVIQYIEVQAPVPEQERPPDVNQQQSSRETIVTNSCKGCSFVGCTLKEVELFRGDQIELRSSYSCNELYKLHSLIASASCACGEKGPPKKQRTESPPPKPEERVEHQGTESDDEEKLSEKKSSKASDTDTLSG